MYRALKQRALLIIALEETKSRCGVRSSGDVIAKSTKARTPEILPSKELNDTMKLILHAVDSLSVVGCGETGNDSPLWIMWVTDPWIYIYHSSLLSVICRRNHGSVLLHITCDLKQSQVRSSRLQHRQASRTTRDPCSAHDS